jgi:predicted  nucleic acid-binding Zn-ribbon protein
MDELETQIKAVEKEIKAVEEEIKAVAEAMRKEGIGDDELSHLRTTEIQLREEKARLREEKALLGKERLLLLRKEGEDDIKMKVARNCATK